VKFVTALENLAIVFVPQIVVQTNDALALALTLLERFFRARFGNKLERQPVHLFALCV
jgi:hypothetical protein